MSAQITIGSAKGCDLEREDHRWGGANALRLMLRPGVESGGRTVSGCRRSAAVHISWDAFEVCAVDAGRFGAAVGQHAIGSSIADDADYDRTLPHRFRASRSPEFVQSAVVAHAQEETIICHAASLRGHQGPHNDFLRPATT